MKNDSFLSAISGPTLLVNEKIARENIAKMAQKARQYKLRFRPHFKTHQAAEIGEWFKEEGVEAITVSSLKMAHYFSEKGWKDISVAVPVNLRELHLVNELAAKISLHLFVDSSFVVAALQMWISNPIQVWIKIDCGYGRAGFHHENVEPIRQCLRQIIANPKTQFAGLACHSGQTYKAKNKSEILDIQNESLLRMGNVKQAIQDLSPNAEISIGDTPACSLSENFVGADEIRPGNFIFYDAMQVGIGSCQWSQVAVCMALPILSLYPERKEVLVYGGSVHFSSDFLLDEDETRNYGPVVYFIEGGWSEPIPGAKLGRISQEHGILTFEKEIPEYLRPGIVIGVLPIHSCLTAECMGKYMNLNGEIMERFRYSNLL